MNRAVFLDRDGTLIEEVGYLDRLDRLRFFPYSVDAVRLLNAAGFAVIVVTNQAGIARGFFDEAFVEATHGHIADTLAAGGARIDGFYYCPHHPDGTVASYRQACDCRKPQPGMLRRAAADLSSTSRARSSSATAGTTSRAGTRRRRARRAGPDRVRRPASRQSDHGAAAVVDNLIGAVAWILRQS